jgi:hypothetical protein
MSILALTSDTLVGTPGAGQIEYNGQFFGTDSAGSRAQLQRIVRATAVAATSGTSIDFTDIPAWAERITVMYSGLSTSGSSSLLVQIGPSGGVETTGYLSTGITSAAAGNAAVSSTAGFVIFQDGAAYTTQGIATIVNINSNIWVFSQTGRMTSSNATFGGGDKTVASTLSRVRLTTVNGTDTFDAGTVNIIYEG